jgi:hypothetical protein
MATGTSTMAASRSEPMAIIQGCVKMSSGKMNRPPSGCARSSTSDRGLRFSQLPVDR